MINKAPESKELFYTKDHEWIEFHGKIAYTGVCSFKLTGFKEIQDIKFIAPIGFKKQGEIIATIKYNDYTIEAHMPVDGEIVELNDKLLCGDANFLLQHAESRGWIAMIFPVMEGERKELLLPYVYHLTNKYSTVKN